MLTLEIKDYGTTNIKISSGVWRNYCQITRWDGNVGDLFCAHEVAILNLLGFRFMHYHGYCLFTREYKTLTVYRLSNVQDIKALRELLAPYVPSPAFCMAVYEANKLEKIVDKEPAASYIELLEAAGMV